MKTGRSTWYAGAYVVDASDGSLIVGDGALGQPVASSGASEATCTSGPGATGNTDAPRNAKNRASSAATRNSWRVILTKLSRSNQLPRLPPTSRMYTWLS